jgi:hypothetical protein
LAIVADSTYIYNTANSSKKPVIQLHSDHSILKNVLQIHLADLPIFLAKGKTLLLLRKRFFLYTIQYSYYVPKELIISQSILFGLLENGRNYCLNLRVKEKNERGYY